MMKEDRTYDVVIVGGSYAGLSAAMSLGRAIRKVLVIDNGKPCNSATPHSHNFLTQDGSTPAAIAEAGKLQALTYPTVRILNAKVEAVTGEDNQYNVFTDSGENISAKKLLFTTGIKDQLPRIKGLTECWGKSVIHCPYCHGYEYRKQPTGILANGDKAFEFGRLVRNWTDQLTLFTNGKSTVDAAKRKVLEDLGISILEVPLEEIVHTNGYLREVKLADGFHHQLNALYAKLPFEQHCKIPEQLGCSKDEAGFIVVDEFQKTSVKGIYAAGDNSSGMRSVANAVAAGSKAGAMINFELVSQNQYAIL